MTRARPPEVALGSHLELVPPRRHQRDGRQDAARDGRARGAVPVRRPRHDRHFTEPFAGDSAVLAKDNLKLEFQAHVVFSINPAQVRTFVEKYSTLKEGGDQVEGAYQQFMREALRSAVRDEIQRLDALAVKENIEGISQRLTTWAVEYVKGSPFAVKSVVVGNIQYPEVVSKAVADKMAATQTLEKKATEVAIAKAEAERLREEARGQADAAAIIQAKLSPLYVQNRAIDAMSALAAKPSTTVIYLPVGSNGVPVVRAQ